MSTKGDLGTLFYNVEINDKKYGQILHKMETDASGSANKIGLTFKRALGALAGLFAFREGLQGARMFGSELANIQSIASHLDTVKVRREITNLSSTLGSSAELANAMYFAISSGVKGTEKELASFTGQIAALAQTIGGGVTPVMDAATTLMNAYGLSVQDAGKVSDWFFQVVKAGKTTGAELAQSLGQIAATAASSGISLDELGAAMATLTTTMPTNIAVTSLAASLRALMNPTDEAKQMARSMGIELSAAALRAKGFGGVMQEIYDKTNGKGDLIGKLFPAESSRAIMALAGTQIGMLKENLVAFGDNAGAAAEGFKLRIDNLDDQLKALHITGQKILESFVSFTINAITLNGALTPLLEKFVSMKAESIALAAKIMVMSGGAFALYKTVSKLQNLKSVLVGFAVKGGYQTDDMLEQSHQKVAEEQKIEAKKRQLAIEEEARKREAEERKRQLAIEEEARKREAEERKRQLAIEEEARKREAEERKRQLAIEEEARKREVLLVKQAEKAKELATAQSTAARIALEKKRHLNVMQNAVQEQISVVRQNKTAIASAQETLNMWESRNKKAKYQFALKNGSSAGYEDLPEYISAKKELENLNRSLDKNQKSFVNSCQAASKAKNEYRNSRLELIRAQEAVNAHKMQVELSTTSLQANTFTQHTATAATNTATAATNTATAATNTATAATNTATAATNTATAATNTATAATNTATAATNTATAATNTATAATVREVVATGTLTRAKHACAAAARGLGRAIMANPYMALLTALSLVSAAVMYFRDKADQASRARMDIAGKEVEQANKAVESTKEERTALNAKLETLKRYSEQSKISESEQQEAEKIISSLTRQYGEFGASVDYATGKLNLQSSAADDLNNRLNLLEKRRKLNLREKQQAEIDTIEKRYQEKNDKGIFGYGHKGFENLKPWGKAIFALNPVTGMILGLKKNNNKLSGMTDQQLKNMLKNPNVSADNRELISELLDRREKINKKENAITPAERTQLLNMEYEQQKAKLQQKLSSEINYTEAEMLQRGPLSQNDEMLLAKMRLENQRKIVALSATRSTGGTREGKELAKTEYAEELKNLKQMQVEYDEQLRKNGLNLLEIKRQQEASELHTLLIRDGELSAVDQLLETESEISHQKQRIQEAEISKKKVKDRNSQEYRNAVNEEEKAYSRLYELERKRGDQQRAIAKSELEQKQTLEMQNLLLKLRGKGYRDPENSAEVKKLSLKQAIEYGYDIQRRYNTAKDGSEEKRNLLLELNKAKLDVLAQKNGLTNAGMSGKSIGSFSVGALQGLAGGDTRRDELLSKIERNTKKFSDKDFSQHYGA